MKDRKTYIPPTEDEAGLSATEDTEEGMEAADVSEEFSVIAANRSGTTSVRVAETEDEFTADIGLPLEKAQEPGKKDSGKYSGEKKAVDNGRYYRKAGRELFPFLLAVLLLLAVTQITAGILWSRQERHLEELYQTYGAGYGQE